MHNCVQLIRVSGNLPGAVETGNQALEGAVDVEQHVGESVHHPPSPRVVTENRFGVISAVSCALGTVALYADEVFLPIVT
jgi:hypothetical protein